MKPSLARTEARSILSHGYYRHSGSDVWAACRRCRTHVHATPPAFWSENKQLDELEDALTRHIEECAA